MWSGGAWYHQINKWIGSRATALGRLGRTFGKNKSIEGRQKERHPTPHDPTTRLASIAHRASHHHHNSINVPTGPADCFVLR